VFQTFDENGSIRHGVYEELGGGVCMSKVQLWHIISQTAPPYAAPTSFDTTSQNYGFIELLRGSFFNRLLYPRYLHILERITMGTPPCWGCHRYPVSSQSATRML